MAQFNPTVQIVDPPHMPDQLSAAVLSGLSRPLIGHRFRPWGAVKTFIFAGCTFGLAPLFFWPGRFRDFVDVERQQLWHLAEWLRLKTGDPDAAGLRDSTGGALALSGFLRVGPVLMAILAIFSFLPLPTPFFHYLVLATYRYPRQRPLSDFFLGWNVLLSIGYLLHWGQVCRHANALTAFGERFNEILGRRNFPPVKIPQVGMGVSPLWLIGALIGLGNGAVWAIVAMLAGVVHWRYVWSVSRRMRSEMGERVSYMLMAVYPPLSVARPVGMAPAGSFSGDGEGNICVNPKCLARLSPMAAFCPRCGARTGG
ncbi:MAG TPA: hypothetical protein VMD30_08195 [Tepidisphaeraceae bacterium]|nr:hypothetical protein [Tepidisphaeraceae bacterium]